VTDNLAGRVAVVLGGTGTIGRAIARSLASLQAKMVVVCRHGSRGMEVVQQVALHSANRDIDLRVVDLARPVEARVFALELLDGYPEIDIVVDAVSDDSLEAGKAFRGNVLGPFLLQNLLVPSLTRRAGRIVVLAAHQAGGLDLEHLHGVGEPRRRMLGYQQARHMLALARARRTRGRVAVHVVHPGTVTAERFSDLDPAQPLVTPERAADTPAWVAWSPVVAGVSGAYWFDRCEVPSRFDDPAAQDALWAACESLVSV